MGYSRGTEIKCENLRSFRDSNCVHFKMKLRYDRWRVALKEILDKPCRNFIKNIYIFEVLNVINDTIWRMQVSHESKKSVK